MLDFFCINNVEFDFSFCCILVNFSIFRIENEKYKQWLTTSPSPKFLKKYIYITVGKTQQIFTISNHYYCAAGGDYSDYQRRQCLLVLRRSVFGNSQGLLLMLIINRKPRGNPQNRGYRSHSKGWNPIKFSSLKVEVQVLPLPPYGYNKVDKQSII